MSEPEPRIRVRRIVPGEETTLREVRLQALADAPDAFDSTFEREREREASYWRERLSLGATFVLEESGRAMGIAAGVPHWDEPAVAFLVSMWIHPDLRGTRAADGLVASVLAWAEGEGMREVLLHVGKRNERARRFYERNGFQYTGLEIVRDRDGLAEVEMRCAPGRRDR